MADMAEAAVAADRDGAGVTAFLAGVLVGLLLAAFGVCLAMAAGTE